MIAQTITQLDEVLSDVAGLLRLLGDADYASAPERNQSAVGAHIRHILDYVHALFRSPEEICYSDRRRGSLMESSRVEALREVERLKERLLATASDAPVVVMDHCGPKGAPSSSRFQSTRAREYLFVATHAVHHLALVRVLLESNGLRMPETLGWALSTLACRAQSTSDCAGERGA